MRAAAAAVGQGDKHSRKSIDRANKLCQACPCTRAHVDICTVRNKRYSWIFHVYHRRGGCFQSGSVEFHLLIQTMNRRALTTESSIRMISWTWDGGEKRVNYFLPSQSQASGNSHTHTHARLETYSNWIVMIRQGLALQEHHPYYRFLIGSFFPSVENKVGSRGLLRLLHSAKNSNQGHLYPLLCQVSISRRMRQKFKRNFLSAFFHSGEKKKWKMIKQKLEVLFRR